MGDYDDSCRRQWHVGYIEFISLTRYVRQVQYTQRLFEY